MSLRTSRIVAAAFLLAVFAFVTPVFAQTYTGRIDATVEDATGARLPGVTITITGPTPGTMVSDTRGEVHFLNLAVGDYQLAATLSGFNDFKVAKLSVQSGQSMQLPIKMSPAGVAETVQVTAEAPVIDSKRVGQTTNVTLDQLQNIPTARDPWVVMQSVPGIVMDRVNVGGSESGQQAGYMAKGARDTQTTWNVDGMPITDMSSQSSPFYYDFDMFQEMGVTTGGADPKSATGGVQMNFMLKSGTNQFHGNAKFYFENDSMQGNNMSADLAKQVGSTTGKGNRTDLFRDWGGDVGGPILKDRWWFWLAYGNQDIKIVNIQNVSDETFLKNVSLKTQGQVTKSLRGSFTFFQADKSKNGRGNGWWTAYNQGSTMAQGGYGGPNQMWKGEVNYVGGSNLFLVGRFAHVRGGFQLIPMGGEGTPTWIDENLQSHDSYAAYRTARPQNSVVIDGNYFMGRHEFKFGFSWRKAEVHSTSVWANDSWTDTFNAQTGAPIYTGVGSNTGEYPYMVVNVAAPYATDVAGRYYSWYAADTISLKKATINLGLRYDRQYADVLPTEMIAPVAPFNSVLPGATAPGVSNALVFGMLQPRAGITYSLGQNNKTQLRATYALFTNQIGSGEASFLSVAQYRQFYVAAYDANGDHIAQPSEILMNTYPLYIADAYYQGFDPTNPGAVPTTNNKVGTYQNPKTHEFVLGIDHELFPNFGLSASYTYRYIGGFNWRPIQCSSCPAGYIDGTQYTLQGNVTGSLPTGIPGSPDGTYSVPYYGLNSGVVYPATKGTLFTSHPDYNNTYKGFEISATKRMANHWMARLGFSTNSWREYYTAMDGYGNPTPIISSPNLDGGRVVAASGASGKSNIYMSQPSYQIIANGLYQFKYDIDVGASYLMRQGYPIPWNYSTSGGFKDTLGSTKALLLVNPIDYAHLPTMQSLDMRIGKRIKFGHGTMASIDFDIFNLFNSNTELQRQYKATAANYGNILEIMQPRIARLGLRFSF